MTKRQSRPPKPEGKSRNRTKPGKIASGTKPKSKRREDLGQRANWFQQRGSGKA